MLHHRYLFVVQQDQGVVQIRRLLVRIVDEVGAHVAAVELHPFNHVDFRLFARWLLAPMGATIATLDENLLPTTRYQKHCGEQLDMPGFEATHANTVPRFDVASDHAPRRGGT